MIIVSLSFVTAVRVLCGRGLLQLACTLFVSPSCLCHWSLFWIWKTGAPTLRSRSGCSCTTALKVQKSILLPAFRATVVLWGELITGLSIGPLLLGYPLLIFLGYPDIAHRLLISSLTLEVCTDYARMINVVSYPCFMLGVNVFLFCFLFQRSDLPSLNTFLGLPGPVNWWKKI